MERLYTVATLAERWDTSDTFVYDEINRGRLGHLRLGGKLIRIPRACVEEYEQRNLAAAAWDTALGAGDPIPVAIPLPMQGTAAGNIARLVRAQHAGRAPC